MEKEEVYGNKKAEKNAAHPKCLNKTLKYYIWVILVNQPIKELIPSFPQSLHCYCYILLVPRLWPCSHGSILDSIVHQDLEGEETCNGNICTLSMF